MLWGSRTSTHYSCIVLHQETIPELLQMWCNEILLFLLTPLPPNTYTYSINKHPIKSVDSHKDLCILVTSNLSGSKHINSICSNACKAFYFIHRSISTTSPSLRSRIYLSLVRSKLSYCSQLWRSCLIKDIVCLERVQRRATKFICNDLTSDYKSRLPSLHLLPLMHVLARTIGHHVPRQMH